MIINHISAKVFTTKQVKRGLIVRLQMTRPCDDLNQVITKTTTSSCYHISSQIIAQLYNLQQYNSTKSRFYPEEKDRLC